MPQPDFMEVDGPSAPHEEPASVRSNAALQHRLKVRKAAFDAIVDRCTDGIVIVNRRGAILFVNPAAERLLGRSMEELLNEPLGVPIDPGSPIEIDILRDGLPSGTAEMQVVATEWQDEPAWLVTLHEITDRKRTEERLAYLSAMIESTGDAIIGKTLDGVITSWNAGAERLYGYTSEEMIGQSAEILSPRRRRKELPQVLERVRDGRFVGHFDTVRIRKNGTRIEVSIKVSPIRDARGNIIGVSTIARDNTRRKSAERKFREAIRRRDVFLAMLSHELRNPLAAIANSAYLLQAENVAPQSRQYGQDVVERQCSVMTRLLEDLLDVSRVSQGKIVLRKQCLDLKTVIHDAISAATSLVQEKRQQLFVKLPDEDIGVDADNVRLQQIIVNLLSNASKYSDDEQRIWLTLETCGDDAVIRVRDEGVGMTAKTVRNVFKPFVQVDTSLARASGGMGIGLALVRSLAELHGGTVVARSEGLATGSEFIVTLPKSAGLPPEPVEIFNNEDLSGLRILIVEDHADVRAMLRTLLELNGYDVEVAEDGLQGAQMIEFQQPDVALVDIGLPELDGYALARRIRSDDAYRRVALVALTGYAQPEDRRRAFDAGFDAHLAKPVDLEALIAVLQQCAKERSHLNAEPNSAAVPANPEAAPQA